VQTNKKLLTVAKMYAAGSTVRETANKCGFPISKSTVHKWLYSEKLKSLDEDLYNECMTILKKNYNERHIRGGEATRKMYKEKKKS